MKRNGRTGENYIIPDKEEPMKIYFLPTVWSDMAVMESGGKFAVIDTGDGPYHYKMINDFFENHGIRKLEFILLSHFHPDHYGCLKMLVEQYEVGKVYFKEYSGVTATDGNGDVATDEYRTAETENCRQLKDFCAQRSTVVPAEETACIAFNGISVELLYRGNSVRQVFEDRNYECSGKYICNENQNSLMAFFEISGRTVLLCGDVTDFELPHPAISMMNTRAAEKIARPIDIYKAPHHGLGIGSDAALSIYRPRYTVVTNTEHYIVGNTDVPQRLKRFNPDAEIFYTGSSGVAFEITDDGVISACAI